MNLDQNEPNLIRIKTSLSRLAAKFRAALEEKLIYCFGPSGIESICSHKTIEAFRTHNAFRIREEF